MSTTASPLCAAWKAEHGGVGGYNVYVNGEMIENVASDDDTYLSLPLQGVEQVFLRSFSLADDDRLFFPELLFDEHVTCYVLRPDGSYTIMPENTVTQRFEDDLDVEPTFPFYSLSIMRCISYNNNGCRRTAHCSATPLRVYKIIAIFQVFLYNRTATYQRRRG